MDGRPGQSNAALAELLHIPAKVTAEATVITWST